MQPQLVSWLHRQGMTPVVAHPERQSFFEEKPQRLRALIEAGAWLQVTVDSLLGQPRASPSVIRREAAPILYSEVVDLATDAHNLTAPGLLRAVLPGMPGCAETVRVCSDS